MDAASGLDVRRMKDAEDAASVWQRICRWGCGRLMLWDVEPDLRGQGFIGLWGRCEFFEAVRCGEPVAYAWLGPLAGAVAQAHFCGASYADTLAAGRLLLDRLRREKRWRSLVGVIPWPYRSARKLVRELGFSEVRVPGLCRLAGRENLTQGAFVVRCLDD